jgi:sugar (glycoside-pentoside-hexuronide) transporter
MRTTDPSVRLSPFLKTVYATGDLTVNTALAALSLVYVSYYLIEVAGLRPALAGLIPLVGRVVDAVTDPLMGRLSDVTRWRWGRRRPYFLIGAVPFGIGFAMLWRVPALESQAAIFGYFAVTYSLFVCAMTVLSVPYLALLPEMALDYDERTSFNTYRNAASVLGIGVAVAMRPLAGTLGGGVEGFAAAGALMGVGMALPWLAVHRVSFERPNFRLRPVRAGLVGGLRALAAQRSFRTLVGFYLCGRVAMDLMGAMLIVYLTHWIGRSEAFEPAMLLFLAAVVGSLPLWLGLSRRIEKSQVFMIGAAWWMASLVLLGVARPDWPSWTVFVFAPLAGIGFSAVDLMPWSMVGDVTDEGDLASGERREGLYNGVFTFLRKLAGAVAVALALAVLDLAGLEQGQPAGPTTLLVIRALASVAPILCLVAAIGFSSRYRLSRAEHARILESLRLRELRGSA